jgi:hypothetical protein
MFRAAVGCTTAHRVLHTGLFIAFHRFHISRQCATLHHACISLCIPFIVVLMGTQSPTTVQAGLLNWSMYIAIAAAMRAVPALTPRALPNPAHDTFSGAGVGLPAAACCLGPTAGLELVACGKAITYKAVAVSGT